MQSTEQSNSTKNDTILSDEIENNLNEVKRKLNENSIAWEIIKEQGRTNKRQNTVILVLIAVIFAMFISFLLYESRFETVDTSTDSFEQVIDTEQDGDNNSINGGDINYGVSEGQN